MVKHDGKVKHAPMFHRFAQTWLEQLAAETSAFRIAAANFGQPFPPPGGDKWDLVLTLHVEGRAKPVTLLVLCRKQLSPRTAIALLESYPAPANAARMLFSSTISPRVVEICRERQVGYLDAAGKCLLHFTGVYIERPGRDKARPDSRPIRKLFSPMASRVTRAMLSQPDKGWQVQELTAASGASIGLVSRVKQTLLSEGYVAEKDRLLRLRDPRGLLTAWARAYRPNVEPIRLFVPGNRPEEAVARWLEKNSLDFALTQYAGAWRMAAMVRNARVTVWVEPIPAAALKDFQDESRVQRVDSGENVVLWQSDDPAVFEASRLLGDPPLRVASPLQLYLDLQLSVGRGEEAAAAVYEQELAPKFAAAISEPLEPEGPTHG